MKEDIINVSELGGPYKRGWFINEFQTDTPILHDKLELVRLAIYAVLNNMCTFYGNTSSDPKTHGVLISLKIQIDNL